MKEELWTDSLVQGRTSARQAIRFEHRGYREKFTRVFVPSNTRLRRVTSISTQRRHPHYLPISISWCSSVSDVNGFHLDVRGSNPRDGGTFFFASPSRLPPDPVSFLSKGHRTRLRVGRAAEVGSTLWSWDATSAWNFTLLHVWYIIRGRCI